MCYLYITSYIGLVWIVCFLWRCP